MLASFPRLLPGARPAMALAVRGRAIRTFGGQALVLTISLLLLGVYMIANEFRNPLASQSLGLFTAAFILATAMTLLIELTQIFRTGRRHSRPGPAFIARAATIVRATRCHAAAPPGLRAHLPYHRAYVDRVRVRA